MTLWTVIAEDDDGFPNTVEFDFYQEALDFCENQGIDIYEIKEVIYD